MDLRTKVSNLIYNKLNTTRNVGTSHKLPLTFPGEFPHVRSNSAMKTVSEAIRISDVEYVSKLAFAFEQAWPEHTRSPKGTHSLNTINNDGACARYMTMLTITAERQQSSKQQTKDTRGHEIATPFNGDINEF